ncbi:MAG: hypothetical protein EA402_12560 [Planctomycetota bacterium]|nr:MAG: hypothetical protein EA402_12560 [Planctomycetota bacterium]
MSKTRAHRSCHKPGRHTTRGKKSAPHRSASTCHRCASGDGPHDAHAWVRDHRPIDESHFMVSMLRCPACGRRALAIWAELIDWHGGDDSTASLIIPVPQDHALDPTLITDEKAVERLLSSLGPCPHLATTHPRGESASPWTWCNDQPFILPHD